MTRSKLTTPRLFAGVAAASALLAACGSATTASTTSAQTSSPACWATATTIQACGGMNALIKAARAEGHLNAIALPSNWANYGSIIAAFEKRYGITVNVANPEGSSGEELAALKTEKGTAKEPDVVDVGLSFALQGQQEHLFAPFKVPTWSEIPANQKAANGDWFEDYGGLIAVGYNAGAVPRPTSLASLTQPAYKGSVCLDGNPESAGAAFSGVFAAALANGGSYANIAPGIAYFQRLHQAGTFVPTGATAASIEAGQCRVTLDWTYLQAQYASQLAGKVTWKSFIPSNAHVAAYYVQAISANAPDPAAARLWETYLYSPAGQNGWLEGYAYPVELKAMIANGTVNRAALAKLPPLPSNLAFPTASELASAAKTVVAEWPTV
ncbi:ABC polyamine/opine/phosphonate transporter, periplasmic ligand binding protein [Acidimicrobium ferrooxidans DSM 10331]|uniref:ABC polyamine/opine/phosphonate transporter, periplasmic ligand binding protein n=1 Tax=Acidimicrobium ferrooxidans (strain DSM 10331 / JCM 15462 / NBRC 103882 / ICP) TaxID=525909 RepID=C7LZZ8_ACIFD|nr:extracellular solute-binding protein [Acidimicrobium ferrooxidans]ACU54306.1 ABC polyamine/opine/phosphonate transporter, periplasmic ligand binding protein [Acidimicrobium ferrooxidans DSM 10331]